MRLPPTPSVKPPALAAASIRLLLPLNVPLRSPPLGELATRVFVSVAEPLLFEIPPTPLLEELPERVLLVTVRLGPKPLRMPPPLLWAELPEMVLFVTVAVLMV